VQQWYTRPRTGRRHRHRTVAHVLKDVPEVLAVTIHEDAAIIAHVLRVSATKYASKNVFGTRRSVCTNVWKW
jgi:DNA-binding NarL/FixJ family response regulator